MDNQHQNEDVVQLLTELLTDPDNARDNGVLNARSFESAGVFTRNHGLVVELDDGTEFQLTVVRSR